MNWQDDAACRGTDPAVFFPVSRHPIAAIPAKRICRTCPVRTDCLRYALVNETPGSSYVPTSADLGVWAGLTMAERHQLKRRLADEGRPVATPPRPIEHGTEGGYKTHLRRGEQACNECLAAQAEAHRRRAEDRRRASA